MSETQPVVRVEHLRISFPGNTDSPALVDLSLDIYAGETLAIVGESGSGKSLTALALMGLLPVKARQSGAIRYFLQDQFILDTGTPGFDWRQVRGRVASMVFQEPMSALNPVMKVGLQIRESLQAQGRIRNSRRKAIEWLEKVQLPNELYHRYPHQLSGGQRQRIMIAMAMCSSPALLIADEPTTALDVTVQKEILGLMRVLQQELNSAMIFITHDLALAAEMADDILVLSKGRMMEYGPAEELLNHPANAYTKALLACRPGPDAKGKRLPIVSDFLEPGSVPEAVPSSTPVNFSNDLLLKVRNLRVWFPEQKNLLGAPLHFLRAVEDVSFDLNRGEVLGLVGESGCGKSTISRALMGLQAVESGHMLYRGSDLAHLDAAGWRKIRREVQMIFQDPFASLNPRIMIGEALTEPLIVHGICDRRSARIEATRLLDLVHLPENSFYRYPHQFSGGQRQRIGIARALAMRPKIIICDESVSALDISVQAQILNLLKELQATFQLSYLFISHDLNVVHYIADRVLVMQKGKIVERGTADAVLKHPSHPYTKQLVAAIP